MCVMGVPIKKEREKKDKKFEEIEISKNLMKKHSLTDPRISTGIK